jgi:hypothetical protein
MMKSKFTLGRKKSKGQSLVELALVLTVLLTLLAGMVEFGNLLNQYINIVEAAREGARFGVSADPFIRTTNPFGIDQNFFIGIDRIIEGDFTYDGVNILNCTPGRGPQQNRGALSIITLDPAKGDDVVISFFTVYGTTVIRWPDADGWSCYGNRVAMVSNAQIQARLNPSAPGTGIVVVEIFYNYSQILKLPFLAIIDPIPVRTYAVMPLSAAEATPTP